MTESESVTMEPLPQAPAVVDLLLRPAAFFGQRRPVIRHSTRFAFILVLGFASLADQYSKFFQRKPLVLSYSLGFVLGVLVLAGPTHWVVGSLLFRLRVYWSGARDSDAHRVAAIFGLSEMVLAVPLVLWTIADLVFAPPGHAFSFTLLLAMAWSIFVAYQGVCSEFVVVRWRALLWFVIVPGVFRAGYLLWRLLWSS